MNKVFNEDALIGMQKRLGDNEVSLIISDPPYGVEFHNNKHYDDSKENVFSIYKEWIKEMHRVLEDGGHLYLFIPTLEVDKWVTVVKEFFQFNNLLASSVYTTNLYQKNNFQYDLQLVIYASKGKAKPLNQIDWIPTSESWLKDKRNKNKNPFTYHYPSVIPKEYRANVKANKKQKLLHPNQKNPEFVRQLILLSSQPDELILDPFMGSFTTAISSIESNRRFIGFELNEEFYQLGIDRINSYLEEIE